MKGQTKAKRTFIFPAINYFLTALWTGSEKGHLAHLATRHPHDYQIRPTGLDSPGFLTKIP